MRLIDADSLKSTIKHRCVLSALDAPRPLAYGNTDINDLIDAQPTIEAITAEEYTKIINDMAHEFKDAEPIKHGRWIEYVNSHCECPECHAEWSYFSNETERFEFCPNCGSDMR